jgi:hypothetical protein
MGLDCVCTITTSEHEPLDCQTGSLPQEKQTDTSGYCGRVMLLEEMLALVTTT